MDAVFERIFKASKCKTQTELAAFLGIQQSSVAGVKKRKAIPAEWLLTLLRRRGANPDWVLKGTGARFLKPADSPCEHTQPAHPAGLSHTLKHFSNRELAEELLRRVSNPS